jgi:uncharacterized membrane protein
MPSRIKVSPEEQLGLERMLFFSDAVMAIAITLLAFDIRVPELDLSTAAVELPKQLAAMGPNLMTFFISFIVIGIYWISHHRYFRYINRYDSRLILLNLLFLFFIVCMPSLANLLGRYAFIPIAMIAYTLAIAALGLSMALIWWYASHKRHLLSDEIDDATIRTINIRLFMAPVMFLIAAPFAYISSTVVIAIWWLSPLAVLLALRLLAPRNKAGKKETR